MFYPYETNGGGRDLGVEPGVLPAGPLNAITDVAGVRVGHRTVVEGDNIRTGVTAILPHSGNLFAQKVPAAVHAAPAADRSVAIPKSSKHAAPSDRNSVLDGLTSRCTTPA